MSRRGRRGNRSRGGKLFVNGGWLSEWTPPGKKRLSSPNFSPNEAELVLPAKPGRAAVFLDKSPMSTSLVEEADHYYDEDTSSSVDSELAQDYTNNLAAEFTVDELTCDMEFRSQSLNEGLMSGNEQEDQECSLSSEDEDSDDDMDLVFDDDSECSSDEVEMVEAKQDVYIVGPSFVLKQKKPSPGKPRLLPGEKKRLRKEKIAAKRRERALHRGVDLENMNLMFEGMVISNGDMLALQPMKHKDLSMVSKLAAIYRLKFGAQGSGKKRFATVTRTRHTALPQGVDNENLQKLLGTAPPKKTGEAGRMAAKMKKAARQARYSLKREMLATSDRSGRKGDKRRGREVTQAVSFVSSGVIQPELGGVMDTTTVSVTSSQTCVSSPGVKIGTFEAHTKGFGSRMLAKMGFVEGSGLGRAGQGIKQPILPQMRPKSLGLGAD